MNHYVLMDQNTGQHLDLGALGRAWDWIRARAQGADESRGPGERIDSWTLSSDARTRRRIRARLSSWGLGELADSATLLVGELIADHARGPYQVTVWATDGVLRCEVEAEGADDAPVPADLSAFRRLACCWGTAGTAFWFEIPVNDQGECRNSGRAS
ncbi:hypothetical protein ACIBQ1_41050 [Nonomuraea sp. NPDC050153]|uniref:hypothetical protein n=1 Tax=Nonomuraea sp. NPDC050153 TaxID=3364359 RepID=UPI0037ACFA9C